MRALVVLVALVSCGVGAVLAVHLIAKGTQTLVDRGRLSGKIDGRRFGHADSCDGVADWHHPITGHCGDCGCFTCSPER